MTKCCFNKKVLIGAGVVAPALLVVSPSTAVAALPVLILVVCPLSMLMMMRDMRGGTQCHTDEAEHDTARAVEIASLHEEINVLKARQFALSSDPAPAGRGEWAAACFDERAPVAGTTGDSGAVGHGDTLSAPAGGLLCGMGLMMWMMMRGQDQTTVKRDTTDDTTPEHDDEIARLRAEVDQLRAARRDINAQRDHHPGSS